jgi:hypothetical protein
MRAGGTASITIQDAEGNTIDLTDKLDIEKAIVKNNKEKFEQAFHTPFLQPPLRNLFGFKGLTSAAQAAVAGVYEPSPTLSSHIRDLLEELARPPGNNKIPFTTDSYRKFWKRAKQDTSCYPGALSFASLKAGATDNLIAEFECALTRIPIHSRYSPKRWRQMIDVMILKKAGLTALSNLHTIVLFHPNCNYAFKHLGREMMMLAEKAGSLAPEQYGSRKRRRAIDLAVNKTLVNDILRQIKRPGGVCSNDAKSCYDLIGHTQASMAMQHQGIPKAAVNCIFATLQYSMGACQNSHERVYI